MTLMQIQSVLGVLLFPNKQDILLIRRADVSVWALPGGGIDPGESPKEAIYREVSEETGVKEVTLNLVTTYYTRGPFLRPTALFTGTLPEKPHFALSSEVTEIAYFPLDQLPPLPPFFTRFIQDALKPDTPKIQHIRMTYRCILRTMCRFPRQAFHFLYLRLFHSRT